MHVTFKGSLFFYILYVKGHQTVAWKGEREVYDNLLFRTNTTKMCSFCDELDLSNFVISIYHLSLL